MMRGRYTRRSLGPCQAHLSALQKAILCWLRDAGRRRDQDGRTVDIAYPELVHGLKTDQVVAVQNVMGGAWRRS